MLPGKHRTASHYCVGLSTERQTRRGPCRNRPGLLKKDPCTTCLPIISRAPRRPAAESHARTPAASVSSSTVSAGCGTSTVEIGRARIPSGKSVGDRGVQRSGWNTVASRYGDPDQQSVEQGGEPVDIAVGSEITADDGRLDTIADRIPIGGPLPAGDVLHGRVLRRMGRRQCDQAASRMRRIGLHTDGAAQGRFEPIPWRERRVPERSDNPAMRLEVTGDDFAVESLLRAECGVEAGGG